MDSITPPTTPTPSPAPRSVMRIQRRDCVRGVRMVTSLKRQHLAEGKNLGIIQGAAVFLQLSPLHIEFIVVMESRYSPASPTACAGSKWLGFSYVGQLENLKKCFHKSQNLFSYFELICVHLFPIHFSSVFCFLANLMHPRIT